MGAGASEIDLIRNLVVFVSKYGVRQIVPLSDLTIEVLNRLPRPSENDRGNFVLCTRHGRPVSFLSQARTRLHSLMLEDLKGGHRSWRGSQRGQIEALSYSRFAIHGPGATRSRSRPRNRLRCHRTRARMVKGISSYDLLDLKRDALQTWADQLRNIIK